MTELCKEIAREVVSQEIDNRIAALEEKITRLQNAKHGRPERAYMPWEGCETMDLETGILNFITRQAAHSQRSVNSIRCKLQEVLRDLRI